MPRRAPPSRRPSRASRSRPTPRSRLSPPAGSAFDAAVRLLAGRPHARAELARKLGRRGYEAEEVDAALRRAAELGYLDDAGFAAALVRHRAPSRGRAAIAAELGARGVGRDVVSAALEGLDAESEVAAAAAFARRKAATLDEPSLRELLDAAGPALLRRGFAPHVVREGCKQALGLTR